MTDQTVAGETVSPDEWRHVRRQLPRNDRILVMGATMRQAVVDRPDLMAAQLAYVCFRQRGLKRFPRMRVASTVFFVVLTLGAVAEAVFDRGPGQAMSLGLAVSEIVLFALCAVLWAVVIPRSLRGRPEQLAQLRQRIEQRDEG